MYFRQDETEDETEDKPTWICTNSTGVFVAAIIKEDAGDDTTWRVQTGEGDGKEKVVAQDLTMEEALNFTMSTVAT